MSRSVADVQDLRMMERCLELARQGVKQGELPFGAVIASRGQVIAEATNRVSSECDVTRHAELVALSEAQKILKTKAFAGLHLVFNCRTLPNVFFPDPGGADWSRGVRHFISCHGWIFEMGRSVGQ